MDYNKFVGKELEVVKDGHGFADESLGGTYKVIGYDVSGYAGNPGFKVEGYTNGDIGYVGVESFNLSGSEMKDWYCKPDTGEEAKEIIERAVANGACNKWHWKGNSSVLHYGVRSGKVHVIDEGDPDEAEYLSTKDKLTIEQVREMFPLDSDKKQEPQWITITNPSDIKNVPVGSKIRIDGVENVLTYHYPAGDNGFDGECDMPWGDWKVFGKSRWVEGHVVEYLLEALVEAVESVSEETDTTLPVSEENDVEASTDRGGVPLEWPIDRSLEGRKVRFNGLTGLRYSPYRYKEGEVYEIGVGINIFGVRDSEGHCPDENYGFDFTLLPEDYCEWESGDLGRDEEFVEACQIAQEEIDAGLGEPYVRKQDLVKQPNHYMLFPEHSLEVKHITKRVLDRIEGSDMDLSLNQAGWLQQALQYLLRCYAKGGKQDIEKAKEALEILLSEEK